VDCFDECDRIGSGFHERTLIDSGRFLAKVAQKARRTRKPVLSAA
jgi:hypothetical protein